MKMSEFTKDFTKEPQSGLEKMLLEAYLRGKGYELKDLHTLPKEEARVLMTEASKYASTKMAQVESTARFREKIHGPER